MVDNAIGCVCVVPPHHCRSCVWVCNAQFGGYVYPFTGSLAIAGGSTVGIQLEDPLFPGANAAAACFAYARVAAVFSETWYALQAFYPSVFCPTPLSVLVNRGGYHGVQSALPTTVSAVPRQPCPPPGADDATAK